MENKMDSKNLKSMPKRHVGLKREFEFSLKSDAEKSRSNDTSTQMKKSKVDSSSNSKRFPFNLKDLLDSGILQGLKVAYGRRDKVQGYEDLEGVITGNKISCHCQICKGEKVWKPTLFEQHAGSTNRHPSENIFLDNGISLRNLMDTFLTLPLHNFEEHVEKAIGVLTLEKSKFCLKCRDVNVISRVLCDSCVHEENDSQHSTIHEIRDRSPEAVVPPNTLLHNGRQTGKDHNLHKSLFLNAKVLPEDTELAYVVGGKNILKGSKKQLGIQCSCCNSIVSPSQFEVHAGYGSRRKPYRHIYVSGGVSLHQLSINALKNDKVPTTDEDDICENNENVVSAERNAGVSSSKRVNQRCTRERNQVEHSDHGCALCRKTDFRRDFGPRTLLICDQCEREFHIGCWKEHNMQTLEKIPEGDWFCCTDCNEIHDNLRILVAHGEDHLPNFLLNVIKNKNQEGLANFDIRWRVLNNKLIASDDHKARQLLSEVDALFRKQFDSIVDPTSKKDIISAMLEGESINNQDFRGMYCAVLTVEQKVICAGIFRVFGQEVAELPLAATNKAWEKQGYFSCLLSMIETQLQSLKVRQFVLPAAKEAEPMWIEKFRFTKLKKDEVTNYMKLYNLMRFKKTTLLKKPIDSSSPDS